MTRGLQDTILLAVLILVMLSAGLIMVRAVMTFGA
ncbi:hypothetical protein FHX42_004699 [Saccharopolyspora lacisalsi]|uniref:Uncharacterized protein n=1 Tax=Halosaccharopolyspora lacisalsi TaxID=1000566 RepID=A0A839E626_9PSEU|nr:hypothetical protein [Halosaccharopolyspora lacisalsi]